MLSSDEESSTLVPFFPANGPAALLEFRPLLPLYPCRETAIRDEFGERLFLLIGAMDSAAVLATVCSESVSALLTGIPFDFVPPIVFRLLS